MSISCVTSHYVIRTKMYNLYKKKHKGPPQWGWVNNDKKFRFQWTISLNAFSVCFTSLSSCPLLSLCGASYASICCRDTLASLSASSLQRPATSTAVVNSTKSMTSRATSPWQSIFSRAWMTDKQSDSEFMITKPLCKDYNSAWCHYVYSHKMNNATCLNPHVFCNIKMLDNDY